MKILSHIFSHTFFLLIPFIAMGQKPSEPNKLTDFGYMIGEWQGKGVFYSPQGANEFDVKEFISFSIDSTILLVSGKGFDENGNKHHDAFGVLYFDPAESEFRIHAFTMQGQNVIAYVDKTGENSFDWGFDLPNGGEIKYSASYSDSTWEESGFYTPPNSSQDLPIMRMSLIKK